MANGARRRQAGDRHRLAPTGLPAVVDLEEPPPHGATDVPAEVRTLIRTMSQANLRWGAPRIHGELRKLGIDVCETTVAKYMVRPRQPSSQTWRTFLRNHLGQIVPADFFVVPTVTYRLVFVLVLLAHDRRRIRHVAVTTHPTAAWTAHQLREAFRWDEAPRYLIHDRDHVFDGLGTTAKAMGIDEVLTAPHAPWQNPFVERFIGSARRECFDHVIVFNEAGLKRLMTLYCSYHERSRTHLSQDKDTPIPRRVTPPGEGTVVAIPEVGGLHYQYERRGLNARRAAGATRTECQQHCPVASDARRQTLSEGRDLRDAFTSSPPFHTSTDDGRVVTAAGHCLAFGTSRAGGTTGVQAAHRSYR